MTALLELAGVRAWYEDFEALRGVDLGVSQGGITALLGANGAGKTTTLRAISGLVRTQGAIRLAGSSIAGLATAAIVRRGLAHVPEGRGTFERLTVEENLRLGAISRRDRPAVAGDLARAYGHFPVLAERRRQQAGSLSGGEQQMLAIARALMLRPRLLLLDEPSFGLAPRVVDTIFGIVRSISGSEGVGVLLAEQNAERAFAVADHACLLETGSTVLAGPAAELRLDAALRRTYLGR